MVDESRWGTLEETRQKYPEKFVDEESIFSTIHRGDRIFIGTGCGEPQYLVQAMIEYVESHPKAFYDAEVLHVWTLGVAPYTDAKFRSNFRLNSFYIGNHTRDAVNHGLADYTPIFLSEVPKLFERGLIPIEIALIQASPPDSHGFMSLGISVDIVKSAVEVAERVIVQINPRMPRVHGDTFIHVTDTDFMVVHEEPLLEYRAKVSDEIAQRIGRYVARLIQDGDTMQVGYGSIPNAILANLGDKRHIGIHTELLSDGIVDLIRRGVIDNSRKVVDRGKTIAAFCMGSQDTYDFIHDNPSISFHPVSYTNDPLIIARNHRMTAINTALEIDLTGQVTAESLGTRFYAGIGGQADFMRGALLAPGGKTILALQSTAEDGQTSRIVPFMKEGAGVTLNRGDVHYVVTEYGIAYLHGKNIRERAMELIRLAHPKFRSGLIQAAKKQGIIYRDQAFIAGSRGEYPESLETYRTTRSDLSLFLRPVKISDEPLLKDFFYSLSDRSMHRRFMSMRRDMPHERLQEFCVIDYTQEMVILAVLEREGKELIAGLGQYGIDPVSHAAEVALVVRDDHQNQGIGTELLRYLVQLAKRAGLFDFTAEMLVENRPMMHIFEKMGFDIQKTTAGGTYELRLSFGGVE